MSTSIPGLTPTGITGYAGDGLLSRGTWRGEDVVVRRVLPGSVPREVLLRRLEAMVSVDDPNVAGLVHHTLDADGITVLTRFIEGPNLATLRSGRGGLSLGEGWRLLADLCSGLHALHGAGVIHGDLSPMNVVVSADPPRGRAVIIDVVGAAEWESGTAGFRAPEINRGNPPTRAADVWSAVRVTQWALAQEHRLMFGELLRDVLLAEPDERPAARELVVRAQGTASGRIELPDEAQLAAAHLRSRASAQPTRRVPRRARPSMRRRPRPASGGVSARATSLATPARGRRRGVRTRERTRRLASRIGFTIAVMSVVGAGAFLLADLFVGPPGNPESTGMSTETAGRGAHVPQYGPLSASEAQVHDAVVSLTASRDRALREGDADALASVTVAGSEAAGADAQLLAAFEGSRPEGLRTTIRVDHIDVNRSGATVRASVSQSEFTWSGGSHDGVRVAGLPNRCVELALQPSSSRWLVQAVSPCAATAMSG